MSITKVTDFSKDSFAFEDAVENKFGSKKIKLTALDQGPLLLKLEDCLSYGVNRNNKFIKTNCSISLALGGKEEFVSTLKLVEKESVDGGWKRSPTETLRKEMSLWITRSIRTSVSVLTRSSSREHLRVRQADLHSGEAVRGEDYGGNLRNRGRDF
jgi:hypothetical protein